ncbi:MAG TPA: response regulator [Planctomycetota bacterium]|nr:response regulator [Planctomycetota bacterium]
MSGRRGSAGRVLVGDDEAGVRDFLCRGLGRAGYAVEACTDGREVLRRYRPGVHALLILDVSLPRETGLEVVAKLRDGGDAVPIILLAAAPEGARRAAAFAFAYRLGLLQKPFGWAELRRAVERATGRGAP